MNGLQASVARYQGEARRMKIMLGCTWLLLVLYFLVKWSCWMCLIMPVVGLLCFPKNWCNFKLIQCSFMLFQDLLTFNMSNGFVCKHSTISIWNDPYTNITIFCKYLTICKIPKHKTLHRLQNTKVIKSYRRSTNLNTKVIIGKQT